MLNGASVLAWTAGVTGVSDLDAVAARGRAISPVTFLPYLQGERMPHDDPAACGVFFGMDGDTDGLDLLQAAVEGMAFTLVDAVAALETGGPVPETLAAVGGGSRFVMEVVASALGRPIRRYEGGERGPAFGIARLSASRSPARPSPRSASSHRGGTSSCRTPNDRRRSPPACRFIVISTAH